MMVLWLYFFLTMLTSPPHANIPGSPGYQGSKGSHGPPGIKGRTGPNGLPGKVFYILFVSSAIKNNI